MQSTETLKEVQLFDADTLEYAGSILVDGNQWKYHEVKDEYLMQVTTNMPLKGVLSSLITFNYVYDLVGVEA